MQIYETNNGHTMHSTMERRHWDFGSEAANQASFNRWKAMYDALAAAALHDAAAAQQLAKACDQKRSMLESIEFYVPDGEHHLYPLYLEGIWMQVAVFDAAERAALCAAYAGEMPCPVAPSAPKLQYWKTVV
jgi:hypothetical protein